MVRNYEETDGHEIFVVRDVISMYDVKYQTKNRKKRHLGGLPWNTWNVRYPPCRSDLPI